MKSLLEIKIYQILKFALPVISIFFMNGCAGFVGSKCKYKTDFGVVVIKSKQKNIFIGNVYLQEKPFLKCNDKAFAKDIETSFANAAFNKKYPVIYKQLLVGSCSPISIETYEPTILKRYIESHVICVDENTIKPNNIYKFELQNILKMYNLLYLVDHGKLEYKMKTPKKYSDEYSYSLILVKHKKFNEYISKRFGLDTVFYDRNIDNKSFNCSENEIEIIFKVK